MLVGEYYMIGLLDILFKVCLFFVGFFVITFTIYMFNIDMKLMATIHPLLLKVYDMRKRKRSL